MTEDSEPSVYQTALSLMNLESQRLFSTFSAFLVAEALIGGFLLDAVDSDSTGWLLLVGATFGLVISGFWLSTYMRHTASHDLRRAQAKLNEPPAFQLLSGQGEAFARGECVQVGSEHCQIPRVGRLKTLHAVGAVIVVFAAGFIAIAIVGMTRLACS